MRAVGARRQFLEILLQFVENHFVTSWSKTWNYFADYYADNDWQDALAAQFEYLENEKWRAALLNPSRMNRVLRVCDSFSPSTREAMPELSM